ncbi:uncharacterized protein LOC142601255 isoform X1 [Balearica regulorum gibbericeps]|uniref:uncharacterized protein LOC142601255 isoform X1 n=1 Tax=Balearica regulorum gibbericeps TaxID=100784 RepID=UPI003F633C42
MPELCRSSAGAVPELCRSSAGPAVPLPGCLGREINTRPSHFQGFSFVARAQLGFPLSAASCSAGIGTSGPVDTPQLLNAAPGTGRSEQTVQQKLRESFAVPRLLVNGIAVFLIELVRFLGETVVQVLAVGLLRAVGDHILKPFLAATFNSLLQPLLLFLLKILRGIRDLTDPIVDILAAVCAQVAVLLRAIRLVEVNLQPDRRMEIGSS